LKQLAVVAAVGGQRAPATRCGWPTPLFASFEALSKEQKMFFKMEKETKNMPSTKNDAAAEINCESLHLSLRANA
jgi:hypothetical protein